MAKSKFELRINRSTGLARRHVAGWMGFSPGALDLVALRADLIAVLGVTGQRHATQR